MGFFPSVAVAVYPRSVFVEVQGTPILTTGFTTLARDTSAYFNATKTSSGAQNDSIEWDVALGAGTYTFDLFHKANTDIGIYTLSIDGTDVGTIDGYNASALAKTGSITGIVVAASGVKRVKLRMATRNASNTTSYKGSISAAKFTRTA